MGLHLAMLPHQDERLPCLDAAATEFTRRDIYAHRITAKLVERMSNSLFDILQCRCSGLVSRTRRKSKFAI